MMAVTVAAFGDEDAAAFEMRVTGGGGEVTCHCGAAGVTMLFLLVVGGIGGRRAGAGVRATTRLGLLLLLVFLFVGVFEHAACYCATYAALQRISMRINLSIWRNESYQDPMPHLMAAIRSRCTSSQCTHYAPITLGDRLAGGGVDRSVGLLVMRLEGVNVAPAWRTIATIVALVVWWLAVGWSIRTWAWVLRANVLWLLGMMGWALWWVAVAVLLFVAEGLLSSVRRLTSVWLLLAVWLLVVQLLASVVVLRVLLIGLVVRAVVSFGRAMLRLLLLVGWSTFAGVVGFVTLVWA
jgi:hypothetical protein